MREWSSARWVPPRRLGGGGHSVRAHGAHAYPAGAWGTCSLVCRAGPRPGVPREPQAMIQRHQSRGLAVPSTRSSASLDVVVQSTVRNGRRPSRGAGGCRRPAKVGEVRRTQPAESPTLTPRARSPEHQQAVPARVVGALDVGVEPVADPPAGPPTRRTPSNSGGSACPRPPVPAGKRDPHPWPSGSSGPCRTRPEETVMTRDRPGPAPGATACRGRSRSSSDRHQATVPEPPCRARRHRSGRPCCPLGGVLQQARRACADVTTSASSTSIPRSRRCCATSPGGREALLVT